MNDLNPVDCVMWNSTHISLHLSVSVSSGKGVCGVSLILNIGMDTSRLVRSKYCCITNQEICRNFRQIENASSYSSVRSTVDKNLEFPIKSRSWTSLRAVMLGYWAKVNLFKDPNSDFFFFVKEYRGYPWNF